MATASDVDELRILVFIQNLEEKLDKYFENVCELDIMYQYWKSAIDNRRDYHEWLDNGEKQI